MKIETIEQAIESIESASYIVAELKRHEFIGRWNFDPNVKGFSIKLKGKLLHTYETDSLIEFARKCQLKVFW